MKVNWHVRFLNKSFWVTLIPAVLLLVQVIAQAFGFQIELGEVGDKALAVVNAVFGLLTILGVVVDPTTSGVSDSAQAMTYDTPKSNISDSTTAN